jgi:hypothetical protein
MSEHYEKFAAELGRSVAHWLAFKSLSGFYDLFSEALLMVPVAEHLLGHGYVVKGEQDTKTLFDLGNRGEANYDIMAERIDTIDRTPQKLLVEMKYLKKPNDHRVVKDFVKLALPGLDKNYERFFLVGHDKGVRSTLIEKIAPAGEGRFVANCDGGIVFDAGGASALLSFSGPEKAAVQRWIKQWLRVETLSFRVRCHSTQKQDDQAVIVLSVQRES